MIQSPSPLDALTAQCQPGWSLPGAFYTNDAVYRRDIERVWRRGWLFAGHTCEISEPGDYLTVDVDTDSVLILRGDDGEIRGMHNVCRHRGSILCGEPSGHLGKIVCPYHQWAYARDGKLLACRGMQEELDKAQFSLIPVEARELEGLIYFSLAVDPPNF